MLKLRKEHLEAFEAQVINRFTVRVIAHVKAVWPAECTELGEPAVNEIVKTAVQRAGSIGLSREVDIVRFVDLSFILARDFETNPLSSWTRPILADRTAAPNVKVDRIYQRMEQEFAAIEKRKGGGKP